MMCDWYNEFKCGHTNIENDERFGCPNSTVTTENIKKHKIIDRKSTKRQCIYILHEHLDMRKLCQSGCHVCSQLAII